MTNLTTPSALLKTEAEQMPISIDQWEVKPVQHGQFHKKRVISIYDAYTSYTFKFYKRII